jgi:serine/threonine-protein kinase
VTPVHILEPICPHCRSPIGQRPFCSRDGTIVGEGRFVIGTRYVAEELLGGGGYSFVYAGHHLVLGKPVAIKVLRDESPEASLAARRFLREARNASQLSHENIISIIDFGHDETFDLAFLVMEQFAGQPLERVIQSSAPMPVSRVLPMIVQLARALACSHAAGVLHRDINPRNVLVGRGDLIKLCDFGMSRSVEGTDRVTSTGAVVGTPAYMAPEQIRGDDEVGSAADIFAFGCTAYEMLTGRLPHDAATPVAMLANRLNDRTVDGLTSPELDIPAALQVLISACLAPEPDERPTATDLETRLLAIGAVSGPGRKLAELGGEMIGSYRVVRTLGKGGVSSVYLAEHPVIGTKVAIKVIAPHIAAIAGMAERFVHEARASSELDSAHIPRYFDFGVLESGQPYAVMEYLAGETLAARIEREHAMSIEATEEVLRQVASAMARVHAAQLVHRDLKPDNLFLTTLNGELAVKILDFGIAKALAPGAAPAQTSLGMMLGTPYYCAPEQAMGLAVEPTADIYALGATAYEMLTGSPPFAGDVAQVLGSKTTRDAPPLPGTFPAAVRETLARMLAREPADRPATMDAVLAELDRWQAPGGDASSGEPPLRRRRLVPIVGGIAAAAVVAAITFVVMRDRDAEPVRTPTPARAPSAPVVSPPVPQNVPATASPPPAPVARPAPVHAPEPAKPAAPRPRPAKAASPPHRDDGVIVDPYAP